MPNTHPNDSPDSNAVNSGIDQIINEAFTSLGRYDESFNKNILELIIGDEEEKIKSAQEIRTQVIIIRRQFFKYLIFMLTFETVILYLIIVLICLKIFSLSDSTLKLLIGATITQISAMLAVIINSVYSQRIMELFGRPHSIYDFFK
jgi:hypothetical protein